MRVVENGQGARHGTREAAPGGLAATSSLHRADCGYRCLDGRVDALPAPSAPVASRTDRFTRDGLAGGDSRVRPHRCARHIIGHDVMSGCDTVRLHFALCWTTRTIADSTARLIFTRGSQLGCGSRRSGYRAAPSAGCGPRPGATCYGQRKCSVVRQKLWSGISHRPRT